MERTPDENVPTQEGWSPPSDTIETRLLESNLLVEDVR